MAGHGDMGLAFKKTANTLFFCATSPDPNTNGVHGIARKWCNTEDGRSAGSEEPWRATRTHRTIEPRDLGRDVLIHSRDLTGHRLGNE